jgi:serine/threonine protein kinase
MMLFDQVHRTPMSVHGDSAPYFSVPTMPGRESRRRGTPKEVNPPISVGPMNEFPENLEGRTFENWSLQKKLGSGHSGVVYRATRGQQQAAVKIFRPALLQKGSEEALARIQRQLLQMPTDHSSLVRVLDGGKSKGGQLYLVMDYVEGLTLDTPSARNMPTDRIAPILAQIADAARYLEEQEIVHRDIKPANIIVDKEFRRATLVDYGVIRPINDVEDLTDDSSYRGDFLGTPRYSPHEFWHRQEDHSTEGWRAVTFYQLGAVAHDLITGKPLFEGVTRHELGEAVRNTVPDLSPNRIRDGVLRETVELVRKCLDKDETKRPVAWEEFDCRRYVRRPLVILVYTGGTIGARVHNDGTDIRHLRDIKKPDDPFLVNFLRRIVRDHGQLAGPDAPLPFDLRWELLAPKKQLLSENASHETWEDLSVLIEGICGTYAPREESIRSEPSQYLAGIIVLHGTDTLAYSAAALSLSLSSLPCPVVLTGSNQPPNEQNVLEQDLIASESDAWKNVLFSLQFIQTFGHRFTEVFVCFNDTVHVGVNLRKSMIDHSPQPLQREARVLQEPFFFRNYGPLRKYAYRVIDSLYCNNLYPISKQLNYAVLTGDGTNRLRHVRQSAWSPAENVRRLRFAEGVRFVQASPLAFAPLDLSDCRVVLLEGYDSGTFPTIEGHSFRSYKSPATASSRRPSITQRRCACRSCDCSDCFPKPLRRSCLSFLGRSRMRNGRPSPATFPNGWRTECACSNRVSGNFSAAPVESSET